MNESSSNTLTVNTFDKIPSLLSTQIYKLFTQGKVLNKLRFDDAQSAMVDDKLFTLVFNNQAHFTQFFKNMGFDLLYQPNGEFYYIRDCNDSDNEESDDNTLKIQAILLFMARHYTKTADIDQLIDPVHGFRPEHVISIKEDEDLLSALAALRLESWQKSFNYLLARDLIFQLGENHYVFSGAAMEFLRNLMDSYQDKVNNN